MKFNITIQNSEKGSMIVYTMLVLISIMMISFAIMRLVLPKFKIAREAVYSAVAVYSADSASEWCLYNHYVMNDPSDLEPGAVFYGTFDDGFGTAASDLSGNGNNLTLVNGPTWVTGRFNGGLNFNGINNPTDYAICTDANCGGVGVGGLDFGPGEDFTVTAWVRPSTFAGAGLPNHVVTKFSDAGAGAWALSLTNGGYIQSLIRIPGNGLITNADGAQVPLNQWSHIAVVFDRDGSMTRYFNGLPTGSATSIAVLSGGSTDTVASFCIGARDISGNGTCLNRPFDGRVDDVRVFNRALTPAEIQAMVPVPAVPLVMDNESTYQIYYPASSATVSNCLEGSIDYRMVGTFDGISRSLQLSE